MASTKLQLRCGYHANCTTANPALLKDSSKIVVHLLLLFVDEVIMSLIHVLSAGCCVDVGNGIPTE